MPSATMKVACCAIILFCLFQVLTSAPGTVERRAKPNPHNNTDSIDSFIRAIQIASEQRHRIEALLHAESSNVSTGEDTPGTTPTPTLAPASIDDLLQLAASKLMGSQQNTVRPAVSPQMTISEPSSSSPSSVCCNFARDQRSPRTLIHLHPLHIAVHEPLGLP
ncbi:hypothetical protein L207DRAFT_518774 [Hyaloscypha variabilis F]|uniref:Uncharacterized protein n=1 Tax=Hyaloscypha variabilis (strain UAMH 11265 / GT02V1 / F) TaxID=1149755 RepID=A0A2J6R1N4_HYAVF|nr:hypothetical protein L207DRAFT_518774 [Hyaloscypha variabilis F]